MVCDLGKEVEGLELVSLHSVSKGVIGECGRRGGYMEVRTESVVSVWCMHACLYIHKYVFVCMCVC